MRWNKYIFLIVVFSFSLNLLAHLIVPRPLYFPDKEYLRWHLPIPVLGNDTIAIISGKTVQKDDYLNWLFDRTDNEGRWKNFVRDFLLEKAIRKLGYSEFLKKKQKFIDKKIKPELKQYKESFKNNPDMFLRIKHKRERYFSTFYNLAYVIAKMTNFSLNDYNRKKQELYGRFGRKYELDIIFYPYKIEYLQRKDPLYKLEVNRMLKDNYKTMRHVLQTIKEKHNFFDLVQEYSDDENSKYAFGYIGSLKSITLSSNLLVQMLHYTNIGISDIIQNDYSLYLFKFVKTNSDFSVYMIKKTVNLFKVRNRKLYLQSRKDSLKKIQYVYNQLKKGKSFNIFLKKSEPFEYAYGKSPAWDMVFGKQLLSLKKGNISQIFETDKGVQIVRIRKIIKSIPDDTEIVQALAFDKVFENYNQYLNFYLSKHKFKRIYYFGNNYNNFKIIGNIDDHNITLGVYKQWMYKNVSKRIYLENYMGSYAFHIEGKKMGLNVSTSEYKKGIKLRNLKLPKSKKNDIYYKKKLFVAKQELKNDILATKIFCNINKGRKKYEKCPLLVENKKITKLAIQLLKKKKVYYNLQPVER